MSSYGYVALVLLFSIAFALVVANDVAPEEAEIYENLTSEDPEDVFEESMTAFISPALLAGTVVVSGIAGWITGSAVIAVAAASIYYMAAFLLRPMVIIQGAGIPPPYDFILYGFMTLLAMVAIFSFIRGKTF